MPTKIILFIMFELLPITQKKALKKEYFFRLAIVILASLLALSAISVVLLTPSYFLSVVREKAISEEFDRAVKSKDTLSEQELRTNVNKSKEMLELLKSGESKILIESLISKIIEKKNAGIAINSFSVNLSKKDKYELFVSGTAKKREDLKVFAESLRSSKEFGSVDLPISNFAKIADIDFSVTLKTAN